MQNNKNLNLLTNEEYKRYSRQLLIQEISVEGQQKLKEAKILFVGAGGLAASALLYLTGAGIGHIGIVDDDVIELSNLHRQIIYNLKDLGQSKAMSASKHLHELNPHCNLQLYVTRLSIHNASHIIKDYDIIIDSTDNYTTRYILSSNCYKLHKVHIYGAVSSLQGQVSVFNYQSGPRYEDISPASTKENINSCIERGVLGVTTGIIGLLQANEAIKIIAGIGKVLSGEMLIYNSLDLSFKKLKIRNSNIHTHKKKELPTLEAATSKNLWILSLSQFQTFYTAHKGSIYLIDIRNPIEYQLKHLKGAINIPFEKFNNPHNLTLLRSIAKDQYIVIYCNSYTRSNLASELLKQTNISHHILSL